MRKVVLGRRRVRRTAYGYRGMDRRSGMGFGLGQPQPGIHVRGSSVCRPSLKRRRCRVCGVVAVSILSHRFICADCSALFSRVCAASADNAVRFGIASTRETDVHTLDSAFVVCYTQLWDVGVSEDYRVSSRAFRLLPVRRNGTETRRRAVRLQDPVGGCWSVW